MSLAARTVAPVPTGTDLGEETTFEAHGVSWRLGLIPWGRFEQLRIEYQTTWREVETRKAEEESADPAVRQSYADLKERKVAEIVRIDAEVVRWGLRGWSGSRPATRTPVQYAGKPYEVLTDDVVDYLLHIESGYLVQVLAKAIRDANTLSEDDLVGFR